VKNAVRRKQLSFNPDPVWSRPAFSGPSLEDEVGAGDKLERALAEARGGPAEKIITIDECPQPIINAAKQLKGAHENLGSISAVTRYLSRTGVAVLRRFPVWDRLSEDSPSEDLVSFDVQPEEGGELEVSLWPSVHSELQQMALDLGLDAAILIIVALAAGLAQSADYWISPDIVDDAATFVTEFRGFTDDLAAVGIYKAVRPDIYTRLSAGDELRLKGGQSMRVIGP